MGECFTLRLLPVFFVQAGLDNLAIIRSAEQQLLFQNQSPGSSVEPFIDLRLSETPGFQTGDEKVFLSGRDELGGSSQPSVNILFYRIYFLRG